MTIQLLYTHYSFLDFIKLFLIFRILMLLNKRQLEKLKEQWWKNDEVQSKCEKPEDQSDGISIQNIGGVFIVIFVGIGMACVTLVFEYWWYKYKKNPKIVDVTENVGVPGNSFKTDFGIKHNEDRMIPGNREKLGNSNSKIRTRYNQNIGQNSNFRSRF